MPFLNHHVPCYYAKGLKSKRKIIIAKILHYECCVRIFVIFPTGRHHNYIIYDLERTNFALPRAFVVLPKHSKRT